MITAFLAMGAVAADPVEQAEPHEVEAILDGLERDIDEWGASVASRTAAIARGGAGPAMVEAHELSIKVLWARRDLAAARLEDRTLDEARRDRWRSLQERVETLSHRGIEARVIAEISVIQRALDEGRTGEAAGQARRTLQWLDGWPARAADEERLAIARETLHRLNAWVDVEEEGDVEPVTPPPVPRPVPEPAVFRFGPSFVLPLPAGSFEGAPVIRGLSGTIDLAVAPSALACVDVRAGLDHWGSAGLERSLRLRRVRGEIAWCPQLAVVGVGRASVALRAGFGVGIAASRADREGEIEQLWGLGVAGRVEAPVTLGWVQVVPAFGFSPYGRAASVAPGASRAPFGFIDRVTFGVGLQLALPKPAP